MRQVSGFGRKSSFLGNSISNNTQKNPFMQLKKTNNPHLKQAIEEAKRAAQQAPQSDYKVHYGFDEIKSLYSNIDDYVKEEESSNGSLTEDEEEKVPN